MNKINARYTTVLLDADGTVYDFHKAEKTALKQTFYNIGIGWTEELNNLYLEENQIIWREFEQHLISAENFKTERFRRFFERAGLTVQISPRQVNDIYIGYFSECGFLFDGALDFVKNLKKYCRVYIATNGLAAAQKGRYKNSGLDKVTDGIFISEVMGLRKPSADYFDYIFGKLDIKDKSEVIIIGDSLTSDMQGGKNAGITTCLYNPDYSIKDSILCDYIARSYDDILKFQQGEL